MALLNLAAVLSTAHVPSVPLAVLDHPSALLVRLLHVLAAATLFGGSALLWAGTRTATLDGDLALALAERYEWLFWASAAVLAATGVGNLGALAPGVPGVDSPWGAVLLVKLLAVAGLLAGSVVRTLAVVRLGALGGERGRPAGPFLARGYAVTTGYVLALVALAEVLAHG